MDHLAHQLTKYSLWLLPIAWFVLSAVAFKSGNKATGVLLVIAGSTGILWNFLFMSIDRGDSLSYWSASAMVPYSDAPLGHILSVYLPLVSKVSLVAAFLFALRRSA